jgi:hypothetical protein
MALGYRPGKRNRAGLSRAEIEKGRCQVGCVEQGGIRSIGETRLDQAINIANARQERRIGRRQTDAPRHSFTQPHDPFTTTQEFLDLYAKADIPLPRDHGDIRRRPQSNIGADSPSNVSNAV